MGLLFKCIAVCSIVLTSFVKACAGQNRLTAGESISLNQTLVSEQGEFALGFFRPNSSSENHYVGVWYNKIPQKTVVWVANREAPLKDTTGVLKITGDRNIALLDANERILWSSNISTAPNNTYAVLLDSGNFVLQAGDANATIWQSFEHPTDTLLAPMRLVLDTRTGIGTRLVSWRNKLDPSPGEFSLGIDPKTYLQFMTWRGSELKIRGSVWTGEPLAVVRDKATNRVYVQTIEFSDGKVRNSFTPLIGASRSRFVLNSSGLPVIFIWTANLGNWSEYARGLVPCYFYNRCGPNAFCDDNSTSLHCQCLEGFVPRIQGDWDTGNFTRGCTRRVPLTCQEGEGFSKFQSMKLPDNFKLVRDATAFQCKSGCSSNCSCVAYAFSNFSIIGSSSRCLVWDSELIDMRRFTNSSTGGEDLYVRVAASELGGYLTTHKSSGKKHILLATLLPVFAVGLMFLGTFGYIKLNKLKRQAKRKTVVFEEFKGAGILGNRNSKKLPALNFSHLSAATNNFSSENKLGEGGFGPVYKGRLDGGQEIAIKTLSRASGQGLKEFQNEVELIARVQHTNLVRLLGWCVHDNEKMLIYDYMPNQSLDKFIFDPLRKVELDWEKRFSIVQGIAQGLLYLHRYSRLRIIHRDLKTSNILLDGDLTPKISDFGLARIFGKDQTEASTKRVVGTLGYMPPEYAYDGRISEKSDVFGFGVMLLEIVSGKRGTGFYPGKNSYNLLGYAWEHWNEGRSLELMDPSMGSGFSTTEVLRCIQIALLCVQENASDRPTMPSVVSMLSADIEVLPSPYKPAFATERERDSLESPSQISVSESSTVPFSGVVIDGF